MAFDKLEFLGEGFLRGRLQRKRLISKDIWKHHLTALHQVCERQGASRRFFSLFFIHLPAACRSPCILPAASGLPLTMQKTE